MRRKCKRCGRRLKNSKSIIIGYGPTCHKKMLKEKINQTEVNDYDKRKGR